MTLQKRSVNHHDYVPHMRVLAAREDGLRSPIPREEASTGTCRGGPLCVVQGLTSPGVLRMRSFYAICTGTACSASDSPSTKYN